MKERRNFELSSFLEDTYYVLFFENMTLSQVTVLIESYEISDSFIGDHFTLVTSLCDNAMQFQKGMIEFRDIRKNEEELMPVILRYVDGELETTIIEDVLKGDE